MKPNIEMTPIFYKDGFKYQEHTDVTVNLPVNPGVFYDGAFFRIDYDGALLIRAGYAWDGPSGPTWDRVQLMRGSIVHDVLYQLMRMGVIPPTYRIHADRLYRDLIYMDGCWKITAEAHYRGLRIGAGYAAKPKNRRPILSAP